MMAALGFLVLIWTIRLLKPSSYIVTNIYTGVEKVSGSGSAEPARPSKSRIWNAAPSSLPSASAAAKIKARPGSSTHNDYLYSESAFNGTIGNKVAVMVESRFRTPLVPLIIHFSIVLGPDWPIIIYTSAESESSFFSSVALSRYLDTGLIQVRILPQTVLFTSPSSFTDFMVTPWLWEHLAPAENILLFQSDSMICANAARSIDDYFEYDFVGFHRENQGDRDKQGQLDKMYTGGLSLRKRSTILRVLEIWDFEDTLQKARWDKEKEAKLKQKPPKMMFEDLWFYERFVHTLSVSLRLFEI